MAGQPLFLGVDIGATTAKAVIIGKEGTTFGAAIAPSGLDFTFAAKSVCRSALSQAGASETDLCSIVATGYGRRNVPLADLTRSEISCHARGAFHSFPAPITIVDIGGQDNKIIRVDNKGNVDDFLMNRKCAAGTGIFLEEIARRIGVPLASLAAVAEQSTEEIELGSFCTVFTFTEIIALVRKGEQVPDIVRAAYKSMVRRIMEMETLTGKIVATGGVVAHNPILAKILEEACGLTVSIPPEPQFAGALGAALHAKDHYQKSEEKRDE